MIAADSVGAMQILESSMLGLRAARLHLKSPNSHRTVTLFPMVHVGEAGFYEQTYKDASSHDVVLVEGVGSEVGRHLTRSYRWIDTGRLGLVVQPRYPSPEVAGARVVLADLTAEEFHFE